MLFTDPIFLFLLFPLACLLFYRFTPRRGPSFGLAILLVISLIFYLPWGWHYFSLLIASITVNFATAYALLVTPDNDVRRRKLALSLGLLYNFGSLIWFKYRLPVLYGTGLLEAPHANLSLVDLAIPIGISFYTFQQAIFLVDAFHREPSVVAYLGDLRAPWGRLRAYVHHAFFVAFFPHLVIGPIVYLKEFQPQVESRQFGRLRVRDLEVGITLIAIGLFKKVVIADNLAPIADGVFDRADAGAAIPALTAWTGAVAYYAQLYFDFSGYSDMAIGMARVLGVRFPINFFSPLKAVGIVDFYRRWHITLTRVIARFMYVPLSMSGARAAARWKLSKVQMRAIAQWLPLLINFEVIALWHGARLTFLVFGIVHGVWYVAETEIRATRAFKNWKKRTPGWARATMGRMIFTLPMLLTFALFRSSSLDNYRHLLDQLIGPPHLAITSKQLSDWALIAGAYAVIWLLPNAMEFLRRYRPGIATYDNAHYGVFRFAWRPNLRWASVVLIMLLSCLYFISRQPPFLYMGF